VLAFLGFCNSIPLARIGPVKPQAKGTSAEDRLFH
jgi:hypothetical protein